MSAIDAIKEDIKYYEQLEFTAQEILEVILPNWKDTIGEEKIIQIFEESGYELTLHYGKIVAINNERI